MSDFIVPEKIKEEIEEAKKISQENKEKEEARVIASVSPEEGDILADIQVSDDEVNLFWNCMLKKEPYRETFNFKGLSFELKTRTSGEIKKVIALMDSITYQYSATENYYNMEATIALAMTHYGSEKLEGRLLEKNIEFVRDLPSPITKIIGDKLGEFDSKVFKMTEIVSSGNF